MSSVEYHRQFIIGPYYRICLLCVQALITAFSEIRTMFCLFVLFGTDSKTQLAAMARSCINKTNNSHHVSCNLLILRSILQSYYCYPSALLIQRRVWVHFPGGRHCCCQCVINSMEYRWCPASPSPQNSLKICKSLYMPYDMYTKLLWCIVLCLNFEVISGFMWCIHLYVNGLFTCLVSMFLTVAIGNCGHNRPSAHASIHPSSNPSLLFGFTTINKDSVRKYVIRHRRQ